MAANATSNALRRIAQKLYKGVPLLVSTDTTVQDIEPSRGFDARVRAICQAEIASALEQVAVARELPES